MMYLCEQLKKTFEYKTDKVYAVSIKLFNTNVTSENKNRYEKREVEVLYTDEASGSDPTRAQHYNKSIVLSKDSCYAHMVRKIPDLNQFYYMNNNVAKDVSYKTSFFDTYLLPIGLTTVQERIDRWALP